MLKPRDIGKNECTGGMLVSRVLRRYGLKTVFSLAGASHTYLQDGLERDGILIISGRHETGTVAAADGYARVSGKLGVALIIADQGVPNAITGIANAFHAGSPVLVLVARLPGSWVEAEGEVDHYKLSLLGSTSKYSRTVPSADRLGEYVDTAARLALEGRPGPTVLVIPQEHLAAVFPADSLQMADPPPPARPAADPALIEQTAELFGAAKKPVIIAGAGAAWGDAGASLEVLHRDYRIPVIGNNLGRGLVAENGRDAFSLPLAQIAARHADLVVLAGTRLTQRLGYGLPPRFSAQARWVQIDIEANELHRNRKIDVPIVADTGLALGQLVEVLAERALEPSWESTWLGEHLTERFARVAEVAEQNAIGPVIHPLSLARAVMDRIPEQAVYVGDGAAIQNFMYGVMRVRTRRGFLDHYPLDSMGIGTPLVVGAAAALFERDSSNALPVVLLTGDGSFGFYSAELHAAVRAGLRLICIIGNDGAWGTELHGQNKALGRSINTELGALPYELVGEGFGCRGLRVESLDQLAPQLDAAFADNGCTVLNVLVDPDAAALLKSDPLINMIVFDDLASGLEKQSLSNRSSSAG